MIKGIQHVTISTADLDRALNFYCGLLGFEKVSKISWSSGSKTIDAVTGLDSSVA